MTLLWLLRIFLGGWRDVVRARRERRAGEAFWASHTRVELEEL